MTLKKEDARIKKTKARLLSTFKAMLSEKRFEDIKINEICERANVRRATFYKHYTDKYDFLKFLVSSLRDDFDRKLNRKKYPDATSMYYVEYLHALVNFLVENELIVKNALNSAVLPSLVEVIKEQNYEDTCARLRESVKDGMQLYASVEITASMLTGGIANTVLYWLNSEERMSVDELISEMSAMVEAIHK